MHISPRTAQKVVTKHRLEPDDIRQAIVCVRGLVFTWDDHPERGRRAIVETKIKGRRVLVVLYPVTSDPSGDAWRLGSAYPRN